MIKFFRRLRMKFLSENKLSKYLLYAIGEIVLVVIGILIALQINNWNETKIKEKQKQVYINSLIGNLKQDSIMLSRFLDISNKEYIKTVNQARKVYDSKTTADSLIKIARYKFSQTTSVFANTFHNETFKAIVASGDIELFDNKTTNDLMQLNSLQEQTILNIAIHNENYIRQLTKYGETYPLIPVVPEIESPVLQLMWKNIDKKKFSSLFMSVVVLKAVLVESGRTYNSEILKRTSNLIDKLKKQRVKN